MTSMLVMYRRSMFSVAAALTLSGGVAAQTGPGPYMRLGMMRIKPGMTEQFETGYRRHIEWHRAQPDQWLWYGWTVAFGERLDWFVDATFGRSASSLDSSITPAADGRDFDANVTPYEDYMVSAIYEFLPDASDGGAAPPVSALLELATYDLEPGAAPAFEQALRAHKRGAGGCRWYRLVAGGTTPRYIRLRPLVRLAAAAEADRASRADDPVLSGRRVTRVTVEVLQFRPELSSAVSQSGAAP